MLDHKGLFNNSRRLGNCASSQLTTGVTRVGHLLPTACWPSPMQQGRPKQEHGSLATICTPCYSRPNRLYGAGREVIFDMFLCCLFLIVFCFYSFTAVIVWLSIALVLWCRVSVCCGDEEVGFFYFCKKARKHHWSVQQKTRNVCCRRIFYRRTIATLPLYFSNEDVFSFTVLICLSDGCICVDIYCLDIYWVLGISRGAFIFVFSTVSYFESILVAIWNVIKLFFYYAYPQTSFFLIFPTVFKTLTM